MSEAGRPGPGPGPDTTGSASGRVPESSAGAAGVDRSKTVPFVPATPDQNGDSGFGAAASPLERQNARGAADKIVQSRLREVAAKNRRNEDLTVAEQNILSIDLMQSTGFTSDVYTRFADGMPLDGGVSVTIPDAGGADITLTVPAIKGQEGKPPTYICVDPRDPTKTVRVPADAMAKGFVARSVADITSDSGQQQLVSWYASGEKGNPPKEVVQKELDPMNQANKVILKRLQELREGIDALEKDAKKARAQEIAVLENALKADGAELGAIDKMVGLKTIAESKQGSPDITELHEAINSLGPKAQESLNLLANLLEAQGVDKEILDKIRAGDHQTLLDKKVRKKVLKVPDVLQKIYGANGPTDVDIARIKDSLTDEQKTALEKEAEESDEGNSKSFWLLVALGVITLPLTAPIAVSVGGVPMIANAIGGQQ